MNQDEYETILVEPDDKDIYIKDIIGGEIGCGKLSKINLIKLKQHIKNGTFDQSDFVKNPFKYADNYTTGTFVWVEDDSELSNSAYYQDDEIIGIPKDKDGHYKSGIYLLYGEIANYNIEINNINRNDLKFIGKLIDTVFFELEIAVEITGSLLIDHIIIDDERKFFYDYMDQRERLGNEVAVLEVKNIADDGDEPDMDIVEVVRYVNQVD